MATVNDKPQSDIQRIFADTNVFITGSTGFIGNVLVEKILRSCSVNQVYLLMRSKKNEGPHTRLNKMFSSPLFSKLRIEKPSFTDKVTLITGDCAEPNLGLSPDDEDYIIRNINIIIHCAATITLNGSLKRTTFVNVRSTRDLLLIARRLHHLQSFVHVSTAFANTNQKVSEEIIYDCHIPGDTLISMAETFSESFMNSITKQCLGTWPNTYTLSKCIAENLIKQYGHDMPISIVRPSIVMPTVDEPIAGWFTNYFSPPGLALAIGIGVVRVNLIDKDVPVIFVPADKVANLIITAVWHASKIRINTGESSISLFNHVPDNPSTYGKELSSIVQVIKEQNVYLEKQVWNQSIRLTKSKIIFEVYFFLYYYLPAWCADILLWFSGKKIRLLPLCSKMHTMVLDMQYFTTSYLKFDNSKLKTLITYQSTEDKVLYDIDLSKFDLDNYTLKVVYGIRRYVLNQTGGNTVAAIKRYQTVMIAYYIFNGVIYTTLLYTMYFLLNCIFKIF